MPADPEAGTPKVVNNETRDRKLLCNDYIEFNANQVRCYSVGFKTQDFQCQNPLANFRNPWKSAFQ